MGSAGIVLLDVSSANIMPLLPEITTNTVQQLRELIPHAKIVVAGADPIERETWNSWPAALGADFVMVDGAQRLGCSDVAFLWAAEHQHAWLNHGIGRPASDDIHCFFYERSIASSDGLASL